MAKVNALFASKAKEMFVIIKEKVIHEYIIFKLMKENTVALKSVGKWSIVEDIPFFVEDRGTVRGCDAFGNTLKLGCCVVMIVS